MNENIKANEEMSGSKSINITEQDACTLSLECGGTGGDGGVDTGGDNCGSKYNMKAYFAEWSPYNVGEPTGFPGSVNKASNTAAYDSNTANLSEKLKYVDTLVYSFAEVKQNTNPNVVAESDGKMSDASTSYSKVDAGKLYVFDAWSALKGTDAGWFVDNKDLISEGYLEKLGNHVDDDGLIQYDLGFGNLSAFRDYDKTPITKILGIGGYGDVYQHGWLAAVNNPQVFADSVQRFVTDFKLDGVDLDWEPLSFINKDPASGVSLQGKFIDLTRVLRENLDPVKKIGFPISVDTKQIEGFGEANWKTLMSYVDEIGLMAYDMHGAFDDPKVTGLQSMTYPIGCDESRFSVDAAAQILIGFDVPAKQISIGYPSYGRGLQGVCEGKLGAEFAGPHTGANLDPNIGISSYTWLMNKLDEGGDVQEYTVTVDQDGKPFANGAYMYFDNDVFYSYDNVESVTARANYVVDGGFKGLLTWVIENDLPVSDDRSLIKVAHDILHADDKECTHNPARYHRLLPAIDHMHHQDGSAQGDGAIIVA